MRYLAIFTIALTFSAFAAAQAPTPVTDSAIESVFLARDNGEGKPGLEVTTFFTNDVPIHCVVKLDSPKSAVVKMVFVAVAVEGVKPDSKVVTTVYTTKGGEDEVNFTGKPYDKWHPGKYRVDIFIDGKLAKDLGFDIRPASGSPDGAASFVPKPKPRPKTKP